ncbi:hypothetical protein MTO96_015896 [Rhipicephalus appendiculatus]
MKQMTTKTAAKSPLSRACASGSRGRGFRTHFASSQKHTASVYYKKWASIHQAPLELCTSSAAAGLPSWNTRQLTRILPRCRSTDIQRRPKTTCAACPGTWPCQDDHPDNRDHAAKQWNNAGVHSSGRYYEHRTRLLPRAECDPHLERGVLQDPLTVQGAWHETAVVSSGTGCLHIRSARKPSTQGVEAGGSTFLRVGECGAWHPAEHSFGVLAWKPNIHLRDTLPCAFTKAESISEHGRHGQSQQLRLEALRRSQGEMRPAGRRRMRRTAHSHDRMCPAYVVQHRS